MTESCLKCKSELTSWMHPCDGYRMVHDPVAFRQEWQHVNPLDKLSIGERQEIEMGKDEADEYARREEQRFNQELAESNDQYFRGELIYRVEIDSLSIEPDFLATPEGSAIIVEGHSDTVWDTALEYISRAPWTATSLLLRKDEKYLCRLISYDNSSRRYLWNTRLLVYQEQVGWVFNAAGDMGLAPGSVAL